MKTYVTWSIENYFWNKIEQLMFNFKVEYFFLTNLDYIKGDYYGGLLWIENFFHPYFYDENGYEIVIDNGRVSPYFTQNNNILSWFSSDGDRYQCNYTNCKYGYVAIGL